MWSDGFDAVLLTNGVVCWTGEEACMCVRVCSSACVRLRRMSSRRSIDATGPHKVLEDLQGCKTSRVTTSQKRRLSPRARHYGTLADRQIRGTLAFLHQQLHPSPQSQ